MKSAIRNLTTRALIAVLIFVSASETPVLSQNDAPERSVQGVWLVTITPRNCTTGDPIPNAAFESIFTFDADGTMLVSFRNNSTTLERTAAHGLWRRDLGWSEYSYKFVHLRRNISTGLFAGKQESAGNLLLSGNGDEFSSDSSTKVFNPDGAQVGNSSCATSAGIRFTLD